MFAEGVFLAALAGFSILGGFGMTIAMAKKKDPNMFTKVRHTHLLQSTFSTYRKGTLIYLFPYTVLTIALPM